MKRLILLSMAIAALTGCRSHLFTDLPEGADGSPIVPLRLAEGKQYCYLTDYLPTWEGADSLTVSAASGLVVTPVKADWSEFAITSNGAATVATIEA